MSNNANFIKGKEFYKAQNYIDAIKAFTKAIEKEENPYIYYERAISYLYQKDYKNALLDLNIAADLQPENPFRFSSRAYIKDVMGDTKGAVDDYEKCISLDPNDAVALNNLGIIEDKLGRKERAKSLVKRADKLAAAEDYLKKQKEQKNEEVKSEKETLSPSRIDILKEVFSDKNRFNEFVTFVKNGFKLKPKQ